MGDPRRFEAAARGCWALVWLGVAALAVRMAKEFGHDGRPLLAWAHALAGGAVATVAAHRLFCSTLRLAQLAGLPNPDPAPGASWTGQARLEGDQVVVRISLSALPGILAGAPGLADELDGEAKVVDLQELGRELAQELNCDAFSHLDESGRTRIQVALDDALLAVVESGSTCVQLPDDEVLLEDAVEGEG